MRSATSAWTITTRREANGGPTDRRWRSAGEVMWYGRLATTTKSRSNKPDGSILRMSSWQTVTL